MILGLLCQILFLRLLVECLQLSLLCGLQMTITLTSMFYHFLVFVVTWFVLSLSHTHTHTHTHTHKRTHIHIQTYTHTHTNTYYHVVSLPCIHRYMVRIISITHTFTHIHTHTRTRTHTGVGLLWHAYMQCRVCAWICAVM